MASQSGHQQTKLFICYRRQDGSWHARWLKQLLEDKQYASPDGDLRQIEVYLDTAAPGVASWKDIHFPSLQSSHALILVNSPGVGRDLSNDKSPDWVHEELNWWIANRDSPPIVVDATGAGHRWLPDSVSSRWPDLNLIDATRDAIEKAQRDEDDNYLKNVEQRLLATIRETERATVFEDLERAEKKNRSLARSQRLLAIASVVLAALTTIAAFFYFQANTARDHAEAALEQARLEQRISAESARLITETFGAADPDRNLGRRLTAFQVLETGAKMVEGSEYRQYHPRVRAHLFETIAKAYIGLGEPKAAIELLEKAAALGAEEDLPDRVQFALTLAAGEAHLYGEEISPDSRRLLEDALRRANRVHAQTPHADVSATLVALGDYYLWSAERDLDKAAELFGEALSIDQRLDDNARIARDQMRLAVAARESGNLDTAEVLYSSAETALTSTPAPKLRADLLNDRAAIFFDQGRFQRALDDYLDARSTFVEIYGPDHSQTSEVDNNIGRILIELDKPEEAIPYLREAVTIQLSRFGNTFDGLIYSRHNLALASMLIGDLETAKREFLNAIEICRATDDHSQPVLASESGKCATYDLPIHAQSLMHLGEIGMRAGDLESAGHWLDESQLVFDSIGETQGWRYALWQSNQSAFLLSECRLEEARALLNVASREIEKRWSATSPFRESLQARVDRLEELEADPASCR